MRRLRQLHHIEQLELDSLRRQRSRHCERSEAIQGNVGRQATPGLLRCFAPRNDDSLRTRHALAWRHVGP
jgi:hypothetical protein